jgi:hypothetical protein
MNWRTSAISLRANSSGVPDATTLPSDNRKLSCAMLESSFTSCETTMLVIPSASFMCLMRRQITPMEIGSRPTNGSS